MRVRIVESFVGGGAGIIKGVIGRAGLLVLQGVSFTARIVFGLLVLLALAWAVIGGVAAGWSGGLKGAGIPLLWAFVVFLIDGVARQFTRWLVNWMAKGRPV